MAKNTLTKRDTSIRSRLLDGLLNEAVAPAVHCELAAAV